MRGRERLRGLGRRMGGAILWPRTAVRSLASGEGEGDARVIFALFLLGNGLAPVIAAIAGLVATRNLGGVVALLSALAWALIPVLLLSVVVDLVLGRGRGRYRGMVMTPLVLVTVLARVAGLAFELPATFEELPPWFGALWSVVLAGVVRRSVAVAPGEGRGDEPRPAPEDPSGTSPARRAGPAAGLLAAAVVVATLGAAARDLRFAVERWSQLGPLGADATVPAFEQPLADGGRLRDRDLGGRVTLLAFWATWCGVCRAELPMIVELARAHSSAGLRVYGVNIDEGGDRGARVEEYVSRRSLTVPIVLDDGEMRRGFRVSMIPHLVLVDGEGRLRYVHQGRVRRAVLEREISELLAEFETPPRE